MLPGMTKGLLFATVGALLSPAAVALEEGVDYHLIADAPPPAAAAPVEITYYFNFACPACFSFEGPLQLWLEGKSEEEILLNFVPVPWERTSQLYARTFYVMEGFDRLDLIRPFFDALHRERKLLNSQSRIADWLADQQIESDRIEDAFESFSVLTKVKRAERAVAANNIDSTPQLVVGGRYRLSPTLSGSYKQLLADVDELTAAISEGKFPNE